MKRVSTRSFFILAVLALLAAVLSSSYMHAQPAVPSEVNDVRFQTYEGRVNAPEFPDGLDWLNTTQPLKLSDLRGKVVLLDFWTYGCINCYHIIPDLHRLEEEFANELVIIGVHSAKFSNEGNTENIRRIVQRYGVTHPVVNDRDFAIWQSYAVRAWPTLMLIDPLGKVFGFHAGEGVYEVVQPVVKGMVEEFTARKLMNATPLPTKPMLAQQNTPLLFPGKVLADPLGGRLIISDSNHHRIIVADLATYEIIAVIGNGAEGWNDGDSLAATFDYPHGLAINGDTLYVADTGNHVIREIDLRRATVKTIAGTGAQNITGENDGLARETALNSPWDVVYVNGMLYIAMAGNHQLWRLDLATERIAVHAGSRAEGLYDGALLEAQLAQPSGIASDGRQLYFADSESSSIRSADLDPSGEVRTIVGQGLFEFGDVDGSGAVVRLQHPLGITVGGQGELYVADTYNSKIKVIDVASATSQTLFGSSADYQDGNMATAQFDEPGGVSYAEGKLYIADTNNNAIRMADLATGAVTTVQFPNAQILLGDTVAVDEDEETVDTSTPDPDFFGDVIRTAPITAAPGRGTLALYFTFPEGYKVNNLAPFTLTVYNTSEVAQVTDADNNVRIAEPTMPVTLPINLSVGESTLTMDATVVYCEAINPDLCYFSNFRFEVPLIVREGAATPDIRIEYAIQLPQSPGSTIGD